MDRRLELIQWPTANRLNAPGLRQVHEDPPEPSLRARPMPSSTGCQGR
jgi:hypothetical protein